MRALIALLAVSLAACATTSHAPGSMYRAKGADNQVSIAGTLNQSIGLLSTTNKVTITIDGAPVVSGQVDSGTETLLGKFGDKPVTAVCSAVAAGDLGYQLTYGFDRTDVSCVVLIAGEHAATIALRP